jgi:plastocyanin
MASVRSAVPVAAALCLVLGACGGDDDDSAGPPATAGGGGAALDVVAEDIDFDADRYEADAGTIDVTYTNDGRILHTLLIEGVSGFELSVSSNGDVDRGSVELEPGEYTLFCDVPGHRSAGMEAELTVS